MPTVPIVLILSSLGVCGCLFALIKGGSAERLAGVLILMNMGLGFAAGKLLGPSAEFIFRLANDGLTAFALLGVTLRYGSPWLGAVMLLYAAQFTLHSFYFVTDRTGPDRTHAMINNIDFGGIILCLVAGTAASWRARVKRNHP